MIFSSIFYLLFSTFSVVASVQISVCPDSHRYAVSSGSYCCETNDGGRSENICSSSYVPCPNEYECEDLPPNNCPPLPIYRGFNNEYDGVYSHNKQYSDGKQVLVKDDKCIWWHQQYRHWWIGPCENVGSNNGYAYIYPDLRCASPSYGLEWIELDWRRGGSDEPLYGVEQRFSGCHEVFDEDGYEIGGVCGAISFPPLTSSGTAGVNVIVSQNTYIETCKWKFQQRKWRCI